MIKMIALLKRKQGMTFNQFVEQYEKGHALFAAPYMPHATHYERRFIKPLSNPINGDATEPDFDVVTEIWFKNQADFDADMAGVSAASAAFSADEEKLFDRSGHRMFIVEQECVTHSARK